MAASPIDRITKLLASEDPERQVAAAIVLGELKAKGATVVKALTGALDGGPRLQRHALEALAAIGAAKSVDRILPLLGAHDPSVRNAAVTALVAVGDKVVPKVEGRLATAEGAERKALDALLARLGGKEAFSALLAGLEEADEQAAQAAAVAMRSKVKEADGRLRRSYLTQLQKVLDRQAKLAEPNVAAVRAALKIIGYLEDPKTAPTLQTYAASKKQPASVRQEALIALRFTLASTKPDAKMVNALVAAAADDDRALAQTALITLAALDLPSRTVGRLHPLLEHPDPDRAKFVIDMLAHRPSADSAQLLVSVLEKGDLRRAKLAAAALDSARKEAVPHLLAAVMAGHDKERSRLITRSLQPAIDTLSKKQIDQLLTSMSDRLAKGEQGWQSPLEIAREAAPDKTAKALKDLYAKLKKRKPPERATAVLRMMCRGEMATNDDRYQLASRLLASSHLDTASAARRGDEALSQLERLSNIGFDVVASLTKDRSLGLEQLYYVGFHLIEEGHPAGEDLLDRVVDKGGRKKIGKMAKNKLKLARGAA